MVLAMDLQFLSHLSDYPIQTLFRICQFIDISLHPRSLLVQHLHLLSYSAQLGIQTN
jgi:hypothetical protein